jgi:hypothetical protein
MKTLALLLVAGALAGLARTGSWSHDVTPLDRAEAGSAEGMAFVAYGPIESPLPLPRVRVTNSRLDQVDILYVAPGVEGIHELGWVPAGATRTFQVPDIVSSLRIVAQSWAGDEQFVSGDIEIDGFTDVALEVVDTMDSSVVAVTEVHLVSVPPGW